MRRISSALCLIFGASLLTACTLPFAANLPLGPQAWVDAPLTGTTVPLAPLDIVSHASDPGGIAQFELSINGAVLRTDPSPDTKSALVTMHQTWQPPGPGTYLLTARGQNNAGAWSGPASVTVYVQGAAGAPPPPANAPTATVAVGPSLTPAPNIPTFTLTENAFCRKGPDVSFADITGITPGETVDIQGISQDGFWYFVSWSKFNVKCWVAANTGQLHGSTAATVVIVVERPTATTEAPPILAPACSSYTDQRSCVAHSCKWVSKPGIVPIQVCQNP